MKLYEPQMASEMALPATRAPTPMAINSPTKTATKAVNPIPRRLHSARLSALAAM
jgi:hypothetical protein